MRGRGEEMGLERASSEVIEGEGKMIGRGAKGERSIGGKGDKERK